MSTREVEFYNGKYRGSLRDDQCRKLDLVLQTNEIKGGALTDLTNCIYNLLDSQVDEIIESYESGKIITDYDKPKGTLRDYQTLGVAFGFFGGNFILGDSVGLGKTVETAGFINLSREQGAAARYLCLTEKNIVSQFRKEMVKFTGEFVTLMKSGEDSVLEHFVEDNPYNQDLKYDVVGTHYLLRSGRFIQWLEQYRVSMGKPPFDILIVDESSVLGGKTTTDTVKGFRAIKGYFKKIIFLNATPFETNLGVFYNQLNLLDSHMLPSRKAFETKYCETRWNGMYNELTGKYKNQEEFRKLISYFYFARTREENGAVMDKCEGRIVMSDLSDIQKAWLKKTTMYKLVFDCPNELDDRIEFNEENVPKLKSLRALLENECKDAESILIFSYYKTAQNSLHEWLEKQGYTNEVLNGDTISKDRERIINDFKSFKYRVLITNVQKGLNFGACNHCIFYSFDTNPSKMVQFEGRTTRSFDIVGKNIYILCSKGKEEKQLNSVVKERAKATKDLSTTDISVVMSILLGENS